MGLTTILLMLVIMKTLTNTYVLVMKDQLEL